jgi:hypothetical protein
MQIDYNRAVRYEVKANEKYGKNPAHYANVWMSLWIEDQVNRNIGDVTSVRDCGTVWQGSPSSFESKSL